MDSIIYFIGGLFKTKYSINGCSIYFHKIFINLESLLFWKIFNLFLSAFFFFSCYFWPQLLDLKIIIKNARLARRKDHSFVLDIKGQKSSNSDTRLIVCYVFNIQLFIASFDCSFYRYLYKYDFTLIMFILSLIHESD